MMPYIQGSAIDKKFKNSLEHRSLIIQNSITEHFGDSPVRVIASHAKHAYAMDSDGQILKVTYEIEGDDVKGIKAKPTKDIPVIEDEDIPRFVADRLRVLSEGVAKGKGLSRTQVREVSQLLTKDEHYWVSEVLDQIDEAIVNADWFGMYEANAEQIRTTLYGKIREIEAPFPSTKFKKIASSKLPEFEGELREGLTLVANLVTEMVDECAKMVFDQDQDEFFSAICGSLKVEAQVIGGLLGKAEKLMRTEDVGRMAEAHDRLAERAKTMAVVTTYMKIRSQPTNNEE